ncbi:MAG: hypothetical protein JSU94_04200 [Phycisphaerales bacterium]|nr:MAG: hypothetical protein JSU94_04200 [Phycisphaerales bacterium]
MALTVGFSIPKTNLIMGENPLCTLTLQNTGDKPLEIIDPQSGSGMPVFRVMNIQTGAEILIRDRWPQAKIFTLVLQPGRPIERSIPLLRDIKFPLPGDYAVSALYEYNGGRDRAESNPVKVKIRALAVQNLSLVYHDAPDLNATCINTAADPPDVVMIQLQLVAGGGPGDVRSAGKATLLDTPVGSWPPTWGQWIAWVNEGTLNYTYLHIGRESTDPGRTALRSPQVRLIPPVHSTSDANPDVFNEGMAALWLQDPRTGGSTVQLVELRANARKASGKLGASLSLAGGAPGWMMNHFRTDGRNLVTFIRGQNGHIGLYTLPWPRSEAAAPPAGPLVKWQGELVAAGATCAEGNVIRGALVVRPGTCPHENLTVHDWMIDPAGAATSAPRVSLNWSVADPVLSAKVRVRKSGEPAVLLRGRDATWYLYDGLSELKPVFSEYARTPLPIDVVFFGGREAVLVLGRKEGGLAVKRTDGSDLPPDID